MQNKRVQNRHGTRTGQTGTKQTNPKQTSIKHANKNGTGRTQRGSHTSFIVCVACLCGSRTHDRKNGCLENKKCFKIIQKFEFPFAPCGFGAPSPSYPATQPLNHSTNRSPDHPTAPLQHVPLHGGQRIHLCHTRTSTC